MGHRWDSVRMSCSGENNQTFGHPSDVFSNTNPFTLAVAFDFGTCQSFAHKLRVILSINSRLREAPRGKLAMADLSKMNDWDKLKGMLQQTVDEGKERKIDPKALLEHMRSRVKGQDAILEDLARLLHLQMAKTVNQP